MSTEHKNPLEALREAAARAQKTAEQASDMRSESERLADVARAAYEAARDKPGLAKDIRDAFGFVAMLGRGARTVAAAFEMAAEGWHAVKPYLGPLPRWTSAFYNKAAYTKAADGTRVFSPRRSAFAAAAIGGAIYFGTPLAIDVAAGTAYGLGEFAWDGFVYNTTSQTEKGRFQTPVLVDPKHRTFQVSVCDLGTECKPHDVTTFTIRDSWYFDFLEWLQLKPSYYTDYVQGAVTSPGSVCTYDSWGVWGAENFKFLRKYIFEARIRNIVCEQTNEQFHPAFPAKPATPAVN